LDYDPIKDRFGDAVAGNAWMTRIFFFILHVVFLRAWYVRRELRNQIYAIQRRRAANSGESSGPIRMLDAGTGFGQFSDYVARRWPDIEIDAVDIKDEYLERAELVFENTGLADRVHFSNEDLTALSKSGPYDLILSVDVMEHILEDVDVFNHFHRVLAPGGVVIINTPSDQGGSDVDPADHVEGQSFIGEHVRDGYNGEEISNKLQSAGLDTSHILYTYGPAGSLAWKFMIKWPMKLLNATWASVVLLPFYYAVFLIPGLLLHALDMRKPNKTGTGLLVVAERKA
jgi:2-polyprenyl-3-methyl-5-hydroxy-6-metoxy-1,4-benzoquinol methylase